MGGRRYCAALGALLVGLMAPATASADWLKAESQGFVVYSEGGERQLVRFVERLEAFDFLLRARFGLSPHEAPPRRLPIYLLEGRRDLLQVHTTARGDTAGTYFASDEDIFAVAFRVGGDDMLLHEYAHHFFRQNFSGAMPGWLSEGLAEYFMTTEVGDDWLDVGQYNENRAYWLVNGVWLDLEDLLSKTSGETGSSGRETYYPLAWLMTHWLMSDETRRQQMQRYIQDVSEGAHPARAMEDATGMSLAEIRSALRAYMNRRLPYVRYQGNLPDRTVTVTRLSASADDLLLLNQRLKIGVPDDERAGTAELVRARALAHGDDPLALLALGHAELHFGDRAEAERVLGRLLEQDPTHVEALQFMAMAQMEKAYDETDFERAASLMGRARAFLARAYAADDANYLTFLLLGRSREIADDYPTENDLHTWGLAVELAPQLPEARIGLAQALIMVGEGERAAEILRPLANDPHGGAFAESVARMIERALNGDAPADLSDLEQQAQAEPTGTEPVEPLTEGEPLSADPR